MASYVWNFVEGLGRQIERVVPAAFSGDTEAPDTTHDARLVERDRVMRSQMLRDITPYAPVLPRRHVSPLAAFANAAIHPERSDTHWPQPVLYRPAHAQCVPSVEIERHTFLVHAPLERYYRNALYRVFFEREHARSIAARITREQQDKEEDAAAQLEMAPMERACRAQGHYAAHDWIVYTKATSALFETVRATFQTATTLLDYTETLNAPENILGIVTVPYPVVFFFCGGHESLSDARVDADESIITLPADETLEAYDHAARQEVLSGRTLALDDRWVALPVWTLALRRPTPSTSKPPRAVNGAAWGLAASAAMHLADTVESVVGRSAQPMLPTDPHLDDARAVQLHVETAARLVGLAVPRDR